MVLNKFWSHTATTRKSYGRGTLGKRLPSEDAITNREVRFSRVNDPNSLPSDFEMSVVTTSSGGKLTSNLLGLQSNLSMATGSSTKAQHLYTTIAPLKLDDSAMNDWEASNAAKLLRSAILWLIHRSSPPIALIGIPDLWWQLARDIRSVCSQEPDAFELAYFIWSVMAERGSTIDGI